jgi:DNA-binding NtrC family response regulator
MSNQPKIMYIDDESDLLNLASSFFEDESIPIDTSDSFIDALDKIRQSSYDLIISDARMPTGSGRELLKIIRDEKLFNGKFILVTGNLDYKNEDDNDVYDLVLFKPLRFQELVDHAKKMLNLKFE